MSNRKARVLLFLEFPLAQVEGMTPEEVLEEIIKNTSISNIPEPTTVALVRKEIL